MSGIVIDARGLSCPQPVVLTQNAIKQGHSSFEVLVSSEVSKENVLRLLNSNNMKAELAGSGDDIIIRAMK